MLQQHKDNKNDICTHLRSVSQQKSIFYMLLAIKNGETMYLCIYIHIYSLIISNLKNKKGNLSHFPLFGVHELKVYKTE